MLGPIVFLASICNGSPSNPSWECSYHDYKSAFLCSFIQSVQMAARTGHYNYPLSFPLLVIYTGRHATIREVAGSIPDGVTAIFFLLNPSGRTVALGSSQSLTEMNKSKAKVKKFLYRPGQTLIVPGG